VWFFATYSFSYFYAVGSHILVLDGRFTTSGVVALARYKGVSAVIGIAISYLLFGKGHLLERRKS
jgi:hypothetical protein